jgi:hypothetical protein
MNEIDNGLEFLGLSPATKIVPKKREIRIPPTFEKVILTSCTELRDVKINSYDERLMYDVETFDPISKFLVGIDIYVNDNLQVKSKNDYEGKFNTLFKATYPEISFVVLFIRNIILPPKKTNQDLFYELFGVNE